MCLHTIAHAPSSMQPSVLYTSSPFSTRYTLEGQTYRHGFVSHVLQTSVSTVMNGSSSNSNLSRPTRSSADNGLEASGFAGSGMAPRSRTPRALKGLWRSTRYQPRDSGRNLLYAFVGFARERTLM